jgi:hypothetical protein
MGRMVSVEPRSSPAGSIPLPAFHIASFIKHCGQNPSGAASESSPAPHCEHRFSVVMGFSHVVSSSKVE